MGNNMYNVLDDTDKTVAYYIQLLNTDKQGILLRKLLSYIELWRNICKNGSIDSNDQIMFLEALSDNNEIIWYEIGRRLTLLWDQEKKIEQIFLLSYQKRLVQARFSVVALCSFFPKEFAYSILTKAIEDTSKKVRIKAADMVLRLQNRLLHELLKEKLYNEHDASVKEAFQYSIEKFDKVTIEKNGKISISG
jgi:hypothetical protein